MPHRKTYSSVGDALTRATLRPSNTTPHTHRLVLQQPAAARRNKGMNTQRTFKQNWNPNLQGSIYLDFCLIIIPHVHAISRYTFPSEPHDKDPSDARPSH
jgi:hypothetical protein